MLEVLFLVLRNLHSVPHGGRTIHIPTSSAQGFPFPTSSPALLVSCSLTVPAWPLRDTSRSEGVLHSPADPGLLQCLLVQHCSRNRWGVRERAHPVLFTWTPGRASPGFCGAWHWLECSDSSLGKKKEKKNGVTECNTHMDPQIQNVTPRSLVWPWSVFRDWEQRANEQRSCHISFQSINSKSAWICEPGTVDEGQIYIS